jgi:hypothetical protein
MVERLASWTLPWCITIYGAAGAPAFSWYVWVVWRFNMMMVHAQEKSSVWTTTHSRGQTKKNALQSTGR